MFPIITYFLRFYKGVTERIIAVVTLLISLKGSYNISLTPFRDNILEAISLQ